LYLIDYATTILTWLVTMFRKICHTHKFIHILKRQHSYTQKNESENLTNQQH